MRPKEAAKREKLRREERGKKRARRKRAAGKVQKCIPLQQECKNTATGFPASRFTLDDRGGTETVLDILGDTRDNSGYLIQMDDESIAGNSIIN